MGLIDQTMAPAAAPVYTINGMDGKPMQVTDDQLAAMDHATLYALRDRNNGQPGDAGGARTVRAPRLRTPGHRREPADVGTDRAGHAALLGRQIASA